MNKRKTQVSGTPLRRWWTVVWFFDMFVADSWLCLSFWLRLWYWIYNNCLGLVYSHVSCNCHPQTIPNITALMSFVSEHNTLFHISLSLSLSKSLRIFGMSLWVEVVIEGVEKVGGWYGDFRWVWQWKFWRMKRDREREREREEKDGESMRLVAS